MSCQCRCHAYGPGAHVTCDIGPAQPGGNLSCTPTHDADDAQAERRKCRRCGLTDGHHEHVDGDCVLRHRSRPHVHADHGQLCDDCIDRHKDWLREIPKLWDNLSAVVLAGSIPDDTAEHQHYKQLNSPSPLRLDAWALLHPEQLRSMIKVGKDDQGATIWEDASLGPNLPDVRAVLARWSQAAYDLLRYGTAPADVDGAAAALFANANTIAAHPQVADYDADLRWIRRILRRAHGLSDPKPLGDCLSITNGQQCPGKVMPDPNGGKPQCSRCGRQYGTIDIARLRIQEQITTTGETA